jgi:hypothetical protein
LQASCRTATSLHLGFSRATDIDFDDRGDGTLDLLYVFRATCLTYHCGVSIMKRRTNKGISNLEVLVAATLVLAAIGVLGTIAPRLGNLWKMSRNHQLAAHELANQLEQLTLMSDAQRTQAFEKLQVSPELAISLPNAVLQHRLIDDEHGRRIVLSLVWDQIAGAKPISLVGWLPAQGSPDRKTETADLQVAP